MGQGRQERNFEKPGVTFTERLLLRGISLQRRDVYEF